MLSCNDILPSHFACQTFENVPIETLQLLLERCPSAAAAEALEGGYPIQIIESHRPTITNAVNMNSFIKKSDIFLCMPP